MKKKIIFFMLVVMAALLFLAVKFNEGAKTIEEAINTPGSSKVSIIHEEKHGKGSIVFSYTSGGKGLYTAVVRKDIMGYKTVYSGVQGDIKLVSEKYGMSHSYFPNVERIGLPIYFGLIGNPDISEIKIVEKKRGAERQAKIIESSGARIWLVYMNGLEGSDFDIKGYSKEGKELVKIDGSISPLYVEQKPIKGYK
jgi:hypothetical protein